MENSNCPLKVHLQHTRQHNEGLMLFTPIWDTVYSFKFNYLIFPVCRYETDSSTLSFIYFKILISNLNKYKFKCKKYFYFPSFYSPSSKRRTSACHSFLCRLWSIATHRDHIVWRLSVRVQGFFKAVFGAEFRPHSKWKKGLYFPKKWMIFPNLKHPKLSVIFPL